jgi:Raf kinase inhibitor-like YbhB/YbcL family protein
MILYSKSFCDGSVIPEQFAMVQADPETRMNFSINMNPHLEWSRVPDNTKSFVVVCYDEDAPVSHESVNRDDVTIAEDAHRTIFYHWLISDIPAHLRTIKEGEFSNEFRIGGKSPATHASGAREAVNDFTWAMANHDQMRGDYWGYDGPCPPWNDLKPHTYRFIVYALDIEKCPADEKSGCKTIVEAIRPHVLDMASIAGTYSIR